MLIGGLTVKLGAEQNDTLRQLGRVYDLRQPYDNNWQVVRRGKPNEIVGVLYFVDHKLHSANKNWVPPVQSANGLARHLFDVVTTVGRKDSCSIYATKTGNDMVMTVISCGDHQLMVLAPTDRSASP